MKARWDDSCSPRFWRVPIADKRFLDVDRRDEIEVMLSRLDDRARLVVSYRLHGYTLSEIPGMSAWVARKVYREAVERLRKAVQLPVP